MSDPERRTTGRCGGATAAAPTPGRRWSRSRGGWCARSVSRRRAAPATAGTNWRSRRPENPGRIECALGEGRPPSDAPQTSHFLARPLFRHFPQPRSRARGVSRTIRDGGRARSGPAVPAPRLFGRRRRPGGGHRRVPSEDHRRGTAALEEMPEGSVVRLLGPLGNAFTVADLPRGARTAIVAGGIGAAPFPALLKALERAGVACDLYFGGRNARELSLRARFDGLVPGEDGSRVRRRLARREGVRDGGAGAAPCRRRAVRPPLRLRPDADVRGAREGRRAGGGALGVLDRSRDGLGFGACLGCVIPGTEKPFLVSCSEGPILPRRRSGGDDDGRPRIGSSHLGSSRPGSSGLGPSRFGL